MECNKFDVTASAYLDRRLEESEEVEYRTHLSECADCRVRLVEYESASLMLRNVERPEVPRELRSYVMTEVTRRLSPDFTLGVRLLDWLLKLNPRAVAYTTGLVLSFVSFGMLFSTFKPIPLPARSVEQAAIFPVVRGSDREFHSYNSLPVEKNPSDDENYYELPRVLSNSGLVAFSHIAYSKPGSEMMSALVEVDTDGRGKLLDVIDAPKDPFVIEQLWWSLRNRTFQPAQVAGKPVPTRIVLLVEKVDISG
jgi:hypothetical protein